MTFSELVGNINGNIESSKFAVYNSIFDELNIKLTNCNLDLDKVTIKNIDIVATKVQAILLDVYSDDIKLELNGCNLEYFNNSTNPVGNIYIKSLGSQFNVDSSVKYGEMKVE